MHCVLPRHAKSLAVLNPIQCHSQGRINHSAKRAMAQGPPPPGGPPRQQEKNNNGLNKKIGYYDL